MKFAFESLIFCQSQRAGKGLVAVMSRVRKNARRGPLIAFALCLAMLLAGCSKNGVGRLVRPMTLRDVPAEHLAYRFEPDTGADTLPPHLRADSLNEPLETIQADFRERRGEEALLRTVISPDGQRALALYATGETLQGEFRLDLYAVDGQFIRNILPPDLAGAYPLTVAWSPDGQRIAFIGIRSGSAQPSPTPDAEAIPGALPVPTIPLPEVAPSVAPLIPPVATYNTEQIYLGDRDGFNLQPLTQREGLIYFQFAWSPDGLALAALACRVDEWEARAQANQMAAGRPRIVRLDGTERLLDDRLTATPPAWSPDAAKVATAFYAENEYLDVVVYDAEGSPPTAARFPLREPLLEASKRYDEREAQRRAAAALANGNATRSAPANPQPEPTPADTVPASFNPIIRLEWTAPETLFAQTGFVGIYANEVARSFLRWHTIHISPQAAILSRAPQASPEFQPSDLISLARRLQER